MPRLLAVLCSLSLLAAGQVTASPYHSLFGAGYDPFVSWLFSEATRNGYTLSATGDDGRGYVEGIPTTRYQAYTWRIEARTNEPFSNLNLSSFCYPVSGSGVWAHTPVSLTSDWQRFVHFWIADHPSTNVYLGGFFTFPSPRTLQARNWAIAEAVPVGSELLVPAGVTDFRHSSWTRSNVSVADDGITLTASGGDGQVRQAVSGLDPNGSYVWSGEIRTNQTTVNFEWNIVRGGDWHRHPVTATSDWTRVKTYWVKPGVASLTVCIGAYSSFSTGEVIQVRNPSLRAIDAPW